MMKKFVKRAKENRKQMINFVKQERKKEKKFISMELQQKVILFFNIIILITL